MTALASAEVPEEGFLTAVPSRVGLAKADLDPLFTDDRLTLLVLAFRLDGTAPAGAPGWRKLLAPPLLAALNVVDAIPAGRRFAIVTFRRFPSNSACTLDPIAASPSSTIRSKCPPQQLPEDVERLDAETIEFEVPSSYLSARICSDPLRFRARLLGNPPNVSNECFRRG